ncbi:MAG: DinB family protein [Actinobacteria bacterium]|nr:DinB family protein [Actinomycetota bacterium]
MVEDLKDGRRVEPDFLLGERAMLEAWLEFHRATLLLKCEGLSDEQRKTRPVATSKLSLQGLIRHMSDVERGWFRRTLLRDPDLPAIFYDLSARDYDRQFDDLDDAIWGDDLASWRSECEQSREAAAGRQLDDTGIRRGTEYSLRWIYCHMIEEYARHNGHADLIREMIDGAVGW